ncbi:MAG TPA: vWA domain-containing protein [Candidatus Binataceae bacterium]|nr:vWA domain-containing protein [Candidatus Binataceae bacterium]
MLIAIIVICAALIGFAAFDATRTAFFPKRPSESRAGEPERTVSDAATASAGGGHEDAPADDDEGRSIWHSLRFMAGPLPLSIALHVAIILALFWGVHIERQRDLIRVDLQSGGGGGHTNELRHLDMPEMPMPEMKAPMPIQGPIIAQHSSTAIAEATHYVRAVSGGGIGVGRGGGMGSGYGRGIGAGFGGFIGNLRKSGLDVVLVIDGTGSMMRIIGDVKNKMRQLVLAIHRLVPTARMGIVVFGGRGEPIQTEPLTVSPDRLLAFLSGIQAHNGGQWQEDTIGAVRTAVDRMGWRGPAHKVIVLVGDTPPFDEDMQPTLDEIRKFRAENGAFNTVDVTIEEHREFIKEWYRQLGLPPPKHTTMPAFYLQTQHAFQEMAQVGGGSWHSLGKGQGISQQVLILAFGSQWQTEVTAFGRGITSSSPDP